MPTITIFGDVVTLLPDFGSSNIPRYFLAFTYKYRFQLFFSHSIHLEIYLMPELPLQVTSSSMIDFGLLEPFSHRKLKKDFNGNSFLRQNHILHFKYEAKCVCFVSVLNNNRKVSVAFEFELEQHCFVLRYTCVYLEERPFMATWLLI